jgi:hypothetical protein
MPQESNAGRKCSVCASPLRVGIERDAMRLNASQAAKCYGISYQSVKRHMRMHYGQGVHVPNYLPPVLSPLERSAVPGTVSIEDQKPTNIPNAYKQLDELRLKLFDIIDGPPLEGVGGEPVAEWVLVQDKQYRLGAMRELRATIAATLKLWEAQRALEERYSGARPLNASLIASFLNERYPEVLRDLVAYLKEHRIAV